MPITIYRTFHIKSLDVQESSIPNTITLCQKGNYITLSRDECAAFRRLIEYTRYSDNINWTDEPNEPNEPASKT